MLLSLFVRSISRPSRLRRIAADSRSRYVYRFPTSIPLPVVRFNVSRSPPPISHSFFIQCVYVRPRVRLFKTMILFFRDRWFLENVDLSKETIVVDRFRRVRASFAMVGC